MNSFAELIFVIKQICKIIKVDCEDLYFVWCFNLWDLLVNVPDYFSLKNNKKTKN